MRNKMLTNLRCAETVEYLNEPNGLINIRITMISGRTINNHYTDVKMSEEHFIEIKKIINGSLETKN